MTGQAVTGFYGKLPACGDFVRVGLPRRFTDSWDAWLQKVMCAGRGLLESEFLPAWLEAPMWRFVLAAGICGPDPVLGVWMPSLDRIGRHFPLTFARVGPASLISLDAEGFLDAAEQAGLAALEEDLRPENVVALLAPVPVGCPAELQLPLKGGRWWTLGGPRCSARTLCLSGLPDGETFAMMLDESAA